MTNWKKITKTQQKLIDQLHEELGWFDEESRKNTAERIVKFYKEWENNTDFNFTVFDINSEHSKSMIALKNIDFYSMCSHHMLPFYGKVHIFYLPREGGKICGISKLARSVKKFASKPQIQEVLVNEIIDFVKTELDPWFVMVVIEAQHLCMLMRGVKQNESIMLSSAIRWDKTKLTRAEEIESLKNEVSNLMRL